MPLDDYRPVAMVAIVAAMVVPVPELGPRPTECVMVTELTSVTVVIAANAHADAKIFSARYRRYCNGNGRQGGKC
jgi:hypothetical protein